MTEDSIFFAAAAITDPVQRTAFLREQCASDPALLQRLEARLLSQTPLDDQATMPPDPTPPGLSPADLEDANLSSQEAPGSLIGPYKIIQRIGAGGMGMVYRADQQHPVRREVALKIIKQGMDTETVIARFAAERQALALMDHPNIARVLDAGTTVSGRPYFVMELVKGIPITRYCDNHRLTIRERLELFVPVCQAIQHAHQKGIIHRDIKPSNVLVALYDGKPVPKVIDFGIAKATGQRLAEQTMFTQIGAVMGTLEYMSPEQAESTGLDIDTRSDIYSLGALLYELLTGTTPIGSLELRKSAYTEMLRKIREDEPPPPSTRLSQSTETIQITSQQRKTDPGRLPKLLHGELDWIVMKSIEKDRTRRYETANSFGRDIERYLNGDAVEAARPSAAYRFKKFAAKNRTLLTTAAALAAVLVAGAAISTWQAIRASRAERAAKLERDRADTEAATAKAVNDFLQNGLLSQASSRLQTSSDAPPDPDVKVRTLLDRAAATIGEKFKDRPLVEAGIRSTIGITYRDLELIPQAEEQLQKAYDLNSRYAGPEDPETLLALGNIATIKTDEGKYAEAAQLREKLVDTMTRVLGPKDSRTLAAQQELGVSYMEIGKYEKSEPLLKQALEEQQRALGPDDIHTMNTSDSLATLYIFERKYKDAEPLLNNTLAISERVFGPEHPNTLRDMFGLARVYIGEEKYAQAEPLLRKVLEGNTHLLGAEHPDTISTRQSLATLYGKQGKFKEALAEQQTVYAADLKVKGIDHPYTIVAESNLARAYGVAGQLPKAESLLKDTLARDARVLGQTHPSTLSDMSNLAYFYESHNRFAQAVPIQIQLAEIATKARGADSREATVAGTTLGRDYIMLHQYAKAEPVLRGVLAVQIKSSPDDWHRYNLESLLGAALLGQKKFPEAETLILSGYQGLKQKESTMSTPAKIFIKDAADRIPQLYAAWNKPDKAAEWREKLSHGPGQPLSAPPAQRP